MATDLSGQSTTAASNTSVGGVSIAEACAPSNINDGMRAMIAQAKGALLAVTGAGTANVQTATYAPVPDAYVSGWLYPFKAGATNTASATFDASPGGVSSAKTIKKMTPGGKVALWGGEIISGGFYILQYDATDMVLLNPTPLAGQWELINTFSPSAAASQAITGFSSTKYRDYRLVLDAVLPATDAVNLWLRTSTDGGSNYDSAASDYLYAVLFADATHSESTGAAQLLLQSSIGNAAGRGAAGEILIFNPGAAQRCHVHWKLTDKTSAGAFSAASGAGLRDTAADVDAVQLLFSSGNIASGTIKFYGQRI